MNELIWLKQTKDKPLFENLLWSRPEQTTRAGRLLIVGGHSQAFSVPAFAYNSALKAGAGSLTVLLPNSLSTELKGQFSDTFFLPTNTSGGFNRQALAELIDYAKLANLTMLAGDFGHNSETYILLEAFLDKYNGPLSLTDDAIDAFITSPKVLVNRQKTLIVADILRLQKLLKSLSTTKAITTSMNLMQLVESMHELNVNLGLNFITYHQNNLLVAAKGQVSSTLSGPQPDNWFINICSAASVWWMQNIDLPFEAMTTAIYDLL